MPSGLGQELYKFCCSKKHGNALLLSITAGMNALHLIVAGLSSHQALSKVRGEVCCSLSYLYR